MVSRVAVVKTDKGVGAAYQRAVDLIGGIDDLNTGNRDVTMKVGIYDQRNLNYPTVQVVQAVLTSFNHVNRVLLAESDNHRGKALDRLRVWREVFTDRVTPFDLSRDRHVREGLVCGEIIPFSHVLFKPNVLVSLHVLRKGTAGSIFKNLLGLIPDVRKDRFHDKLGSALVDIAEAVGWPDLAVIDATYVYGRTWQEGVPLKRARRDLLIVGRDPVAVETVGSVVAGEDPHTLPTIATAMERGLGEADVNRIEVLGDAVEGVV